MLLQRWRCSPQTSLPSTPLPPAGDNLAVTTGDAVQAATVLLLHAAQGLPLLPVAPQAMSVMLLLPTPPSFFGNAVRMLSVSLPAGTAQPADGNGAGALCQLAGAIRAATLRFRQDPVRKREAAAGGLLLGRFVWRVCTCISATNCPTVVHTRLR